MEMRAGVHKLCEKFVVEIGWPFSLLSYKAAHICESKYYVDCKLLFSAKIFAADYFTI